MEGSEKHMLSYGPLSTECALLPRARVAPCITQLALRWASHCAEVDAERCDASSLDARVKQSHSSGAASLSFRESILERIAATCTDAHSHAPKGTLLRFERPAASSRTEEDDERRLKLGAEPRVSLPVIAPHFLDAMFGGSPA